MKSSFPTVVPLNTCSIRHISVTISSSKGISCCCSPITQVPTLHLDVCWQPRGSGEGVGLCITPGLTRTWGLLVGDPMDAGVVPNRRSPGYPLWRLSAGPVQKEQREEPKKDQKQSWKDSWKLWIGFIALEKVMQSFLNYINAEKYLKLIHFWRRKSFPSTVPIPYTSPHSLFSFFCSRHHFPLSSLSQKVSVAPSKSSLCNLSSTDLPAELPCSFLDLMCCPISRIHLN